MRSAMGREVCRDRSWGPGLASWGCRPLRELHWRGSLRQAQGREVGRGREPGVGRGGLDAPGRDGK